MKNVLSFSLFLFFCLSLTFCGGPNADSNESSEPGLTDSTILMGTWTPLTGPASAWSTPTMGMDAYLKMINEEGGVHGRKINLIIKDDAYDPSRTVPAVREMVLKDEVFGFVGGIGTAPGLAVKDFITENNIPWICPISGSTHWAYPPVENIFSVYPLYFDEAAIQTNYALDSLGATKIGIIYQNDDFGKSGLVSMQNELEKRGLEVATAVSVELTDSDLSTQAARLKDSGAEVVMLWVTPRHAAIIMGTTSVMGFKPQWMASSVLSDMYLMHDITKGAWSGVIYTYFGTMASDTSNAFIAKYQKAMKKFYPDVRWSAYTYSGFVYGEVLVEGLKRAGKALTREGLIKAMEEIKGWQASGLPITFGPEQRQGIRAAFLVKVITGTEYEILTDVVASKADVSDLIQKLEKS